MKRKMFLFVSLVLMCATGVFAQEAGSESPAGIMIDLGTFAGITAVVSAIVTQVLKVIPAINGSKLAKIGVSAGVGIVVCLLGWALQVSAPLEGLAWWQALVYGLASGLSGCGFYDLIKAIAALFRKGDE